MFIKYESYDQADKMTEEIFRHDGYMFEFEAVVKALDGDWVEMDSTAFYPGGGGQVCDTGTIRNCVVTEVKYKGDNIVHLAPNHDLKVGDRCWCSVDWNRRFDLMMGHTGEHLLFCALKRQDPELVITKINIDPENKFVIVNHDVSWEDIGKAIVFANQAISDNLSVTKSVMDRDDPELESVRIKMDRISEDEEITVVSIGDIDLSACSGVHVMETSELGMILVDRKVSAGKDGIAIHFKVGDEAKNTALELANVCLRTVDVADSKVTDIVKSVANLKKESELNREALKDMTKKLTAGLVSKPVNGVDVYTLIVNGGDKKILTEAAESIKAEGGVAAFIIGGETASVMLASGNKDVDSKKILGEVLTEFNGRGGGKPDFAQGGTPEVGKMDEIMASILNKI